MKFKVLALFGLCSLLTLPMAATSDAAIVTDQNTATVAPQSGATPDGETGTAPSLIGLFAPKAEGRTCYGQCLQTEIPIYCSGLSGSELQSCTNAIAEGCRCSCGLYCP